MIQAREGSFTRYGLLLKLVLRCTSCVPEGGKNRAIKVKHTKKKIRKDELFLFLKFYWHPNQIFQGCRVTWANVSSSELELNADVTHHFRDLGFLSHGSYSVRLGTWTWRRQLAEVQSHRLIGEDTGLRVIFFSNMIDVVVGAKWTWSQWGKISSLVEKLVVVRVQRLESMSWKPEEGDRKWKWPLVTLHYAHMQRGWSHMCDLQAQCV